MPLYEYKCSKCGIVFEILQKTADSSTGSCPSCGAKARKLLSAPTLQFKGSGWYITDYRKKDTKDKSSKTKENQKPAPKTEASSQRTTS